MERTVNDLRAVMTEAGEHAPANPHRAADVRRRRRRGDRTRLLAFATVTTMAVTAGTLPLLRDDASEPAAAYTLAANDPSPLPETVLGMPRIGVRTFTTVGVKARVRFTPTGRDTAIVVRCATGFTMAQWRDGALEVTGPCGGVRQTVSVEDDKGPIRKGKPFTLEVAILKGEPEPVLDPMDDSEFEQYVKGQTPMPSDWWIAVYSGDCRGEPPCPT